MVLESLKSPFQAEKGKVNRLTGLVRRHRALPNKPGEYYTSEDLYRKSGIENPEGQPPVKTNHVTEIEWAVYVLGRNGDYTREEMISGLPKVAQVREEGYRVPDPRNDFAVSPLDGKAKFTEDVERCIFLILAGNDIATGEPISTLAHVAPGVIFSPERSKGIDDLEVNRAALNNLYSSDPIVQFRDAVRDETKVALIGGGTYDFENHKTDIIYRMMVRELGRMNLRELGLRTRVIPPQFSQWGMTHVYYDTPKRDLTLLQVKDVIGDRPESFDALHVDTAANSWKNSGIEPTGFWLPHQ